MYSKVKETSEIAETLLNDDLRNHRSVIGEQVYLFIIGRETVKNIIPAESSTSEMIDKLVLFSIYQTETNRASLDASATITDFAHHLGQTFQTRYDRFADWCKKFLQDGGSQFQLSDPALSFIEAGQGIVPEPTMKTFEILGVDRTKWSALTEAVKNDFHSHRWVDLLDEIPQSGRNPHKNQTFTGLILRGALTIDKEETSSIRITSGPDGLSLSLDVLSRPQPLTTPKESFSDLRGITKEMVDTRSRRSMIERGFVKTRDGDWLHITEVREETDKDTGKPYFTPIRASASMIVDEDRSTSSTAKDKMLNNILKTVGSAVVKKVGGKFFSSSTVTPAAPTSTDKI